MTAKTSTKGSGGKTKTTKKKQAARAASAQAAKKPAVKAETEEVARKVQPAVKPPEEQKRGLRLWNIRLGLALLVLAVAVVVAGNSFSAPLTTQYLARDVLATEAAGGTVTLATAIRHLADVHVSWLVAAFLTTLAAFFLLLATVWREHYEAWLDRGVNKLRWVGLGATTGVMGVTVAMLSGISDLGYLVLIFAALAVLGALSTIVELIGPGRRLRKYVIIAALCAAALPVLAIGLTLVGVVLYNGSLPTYLYFVYVSMLLFVVAFALTCIMRLRRRGKWADTFFAERGFMLLGFAATTVLAMQIFAGALLS